MQIKSSILLVILTLFSITAYLQDVNELKELKLISNPKKLNSDIVARRDQNGNYCAAIQLVSDMDGFSYDSNDGIVGDIDDNPGLDIVYLTASERVLKIFNRGYKPLEIVLIEHGISLRTGQMWQIEIGSDRIDDKILVMFKTNPVEASIYIDNILIKGNSGSIPVGQHSLRIIKKGYLTIEKEIVIDKQHVYFEEELEKVVDAILQVESIPPAGKVYINDSLLGETPISVYYPPGRYPVRIVKEGYEIQENNYIDIVAPQTRKIFNLDENVCYLTVNTKAGTQVYFNNELRKKIKQVKLEPQAITVKVVFFNSEAIEKKVNLERDDNVVLDLYPSIKTGSFQITVVPFNSKIELTSSNCDQYFATGGNIFSELLVGRYIIKVTAPGYEPFVEVVEAMSNEKLNRVVKLSPVISNPVDLAPIEMVMVKGGSFMMGCKAEQSICAEDEKPAHEVTLEDFYMGKYEVTQKEWFAVMEYNPSTNKECDYYPVNNVSYLEIITFIKKLNRKTGLKYRLPTEAEWEYAALGGNLSNAYQYSGSDSLNKIGWYDANSNGSIHTVGHKDCNELGIFDMSGNVWEICHDYYDEDYYKTSPVKNPENLRGGNYRTARGGSYFYLSVYSRVSSRFKVTPDYADFNLGFRLARKP